PFPVTFNQGGFIESVKTFNMDDYLTKVTAFKDRLGISESGHASQSLGDRLLEEMSK
ncbi:CDP-glycerol--poly(glycerophosphate) glycerophosphotransferase, partial [Enterococcus faecalis]|nr:CDP-glycerol--poly(glycerophosphate) glycerophosphotransferase [Enterococcus faecalis]